MNVKNYKKIGLILLLILSPGLHADGYFSDMWDSTKEKASKFAASVTASAKAAWAKFSKSVQEDVDKEKKAAAAEVVKNQAALDKVLAVEETDAEKEEREAKELEEQAKQLEGEMLSEDEGLDSQEEYDYLKSLDEVVGDDEVVSEDYETTD